VRARALLPLIAVLLGAAGCGSDEPDYDLRTPMPYVGAAPVAPTGQKLVDREMGEDDARRLRPVIADWAAAVRSGDVDRASRFFTLPALVYLLGAGDEPLSVNSPQVAAAFNASFPCGAKLLTTKADGRYVVGTFVLVDRAQLNCRRQGDLARIGFVFGDKERPERFTEWWQFAVKPDASPGPAARPSSATAATVSDF
jgi:hypothetical protein